MGRTTTAVLWLVSRALVLWLFFGAEHWVTGDIAYFADSLGHLGERGIGLTLVEYPLVGVGLLAFPWLLAGAAGHPEAYPEVVMGLALATDAGFTVLLYMLGGRNRTAGVAAWLLAVPLLGATTFARFDLVPGVLAGAAVLLLARRPRVAAACAAVAAAAKLWPALLLPALAAPVRSRRAILVLAVATAALLAGVTLLAAGWDRLLSPLTWQSDRGLQIESVAATPAMAGWALDPAKWTVAYARSNAFEVSGPGVDTLLIAGQVAAALVLAALAAVWIRLWRAGRTVTAETVVWTCLAGVTGFIVTSRVLSPQYLLWVLPLAAAGLLVARPDARTLRRWVVLLLGTTALTHLVFPTFYGALTRHDQTSPQVVLLLAVRNVLLVALFVMAFHKALTRVREDAGAAAGQRGMPLDRHPPGPAGGDERNLR